MKWRSKLFKSATTLAAMSLLVGSLGAISASAAPTAKERVAVTKSAQIGAQNISYKVRDEVGKAKKADRTILLIHGASANLLSTDTLAEELGERFSKAQIVQIDLPAHGQSTGPVVDSVSGLADVVEEFIEEKRDSGEFANRVVVAGVSMGGSVTQELAVRNINGLEKVVLISTSPEWHHFEGMQYLTGPQFDAMYPGMIESDFAVNTTPEQQAAFHLWFPSLIPAQETSLGDIRALLGFNIVDRLEKITKKTLIIAGMADATAPFANAQLMASKIKKATLVPIEGETHTYSMKQPGAVADLIYDFVK